MTVKSYGLSESTSITNAITFQKSNDTIAILLSLLSAFTTILPSSVSCAIAPIFELPIGTELTLEYDGSQKYFVNMHENLQKD